MKAATKLFKEVTAELLASKKAIMCEVLPGLDATQVLASHFLQIDFNICHSYSLYDLCRYLSLIVQSLKGRRRVYPTDPKDILAIECGRLVVSI